MSVAVLRFAPPLTLGLFLVPIAAGLLGTALPAFGYMPALGLDTLSLDAWRQLAATPGIADTLRVTVTTGLGATLVSLVLAVGFCAAAHDRPWMRVLERSIAPLLATPHAAIAIGFAFLVLPSGWIARLVSPELTGWTRPPALVTVRDPFGLSLVAGLLLKEVPYLVLMTIAAGAQVRVSAHVASARALGYGAAKAWLIGVLPQIYPQIRLPILAVLAFSLSVVDVAMILGPGTPPPLSVLATRWFQDYDLALYPRAAAAALLQLVLVGIAVAVWCLLEQPVARLGAAWIRTGVRRDWADVFARIAGGFTVVIGTAAMLALVGVVVWSVSGDWRFPDAWPAEVTPETWIRIGPDVARPFWLTLSIGAFATLCAVVLVLACLEQEHRAGRTAGQDALWLLYVPLLIPQIAFLFGAQVTLVRLSLDGTLVAVVWSHLIFVLPYVFLSLSDPFRALDPRYVRSAAALGVGPNAAFVRVKLPILLKPVLIAIAVGFAVSVGQYLPTLFAGAGRISTLTTEAVTLASGADRRILGVYATLQALLPLTIYLTALLLPPLLYRNRRGLR